MPLYTPHITISLQAVDGAELGTSIGAPPTSSYVSGSRRSAVNNEAGPSRVPLGAVLPPPPSILNLFLLPLLFLPLSGSGVHW
jgi:hypothetical protein